MGAWPGALLRGSAPDPEVYRSAARMKGWEVLVRVLYESSPQAKNNSMRSCFHFLVDPPHFHKQIELCALLVAEIFMRSP